MIERLREIDEAIAASGSSQTIERISWQGSRASSPKIGRSTSPLRSMRWTSSSRMAESGGAVPGFGAPQQEVDVDQVFAKFKEGVSAQVSESDSSTHYDLGVAYKEMGLLRDAIREFELAARDAPRQCMCYAMIGMIHLELGEHDKAASAYKRALEAEEKSLEQEMALYYDLGNVYEIKGSPEEALYYFQVIARRDPAYRDVRDRIAALQPKQPEPSARAGGTRGQRRRRIRPSLRRASSSSRSSQEL